MNHFFFLTAISRAVVPANNPESVIDSPYDDRKNGKNIITKMPKPKPLTRCMKLAAKVRMNMKIYVASISVYSCYSLGLLIYPLIGHAEFLVGKQLGKAANLFQAQ